MGITIFARGKLDRIEDIPRLIESVKDSAEEYGWTYQILDDAFDIIKSDAAMSHSASVVNAARVKGTLGLKGIVVNAGSGSEPLSILFDRTGVLTDMFQQLAWIQKNGRSGRFSACKTQFGNIDIHVRIIEILDRLKQGYLANLVVEDEGGYWEGRDRRLLAEKRVFLGQCLRCTEMVINSIKISDGDPRNADALVERIEEAFLKAEDDGTLLACK